MGRYTEHLVGTENFQDGIRRVAVGTAVKLTPQPESESGPRTIAAIGKNAGTIGYVSSDWLKATMLDDRTPVASRVAEIVRDSSSEKLSVILDIRTAEDAVAALSGSQITATVPSGAAIGSKNKGRSCATIAVVGVAVLVGLAVLGSHLPKPSKTERVADSDGATVVGGSPSLSPQTGPDSAANGPEITKQEFDELRPGMTFSQAQAIVGSAGEILSESDVAGYHTVMVKWDGSNFGGNANAMFQNGRLTTKAQLGLR